MKYIFIILCLLFAPNVYAGEEISAQEEDTAVEEAENISHRFRQRQVVQNTVKVNDKNKKEELNPAQIYEQKMLEQKRLKYKPRAKNKRTSGSRKSASKSKRSGSSSRSGSGSSGGKGLPSLRSGMFVK